MLNIYVVVIFHVCVVMEADALIFFPKARTNSFCQEMNCFLWSFLWEAFWLTLILITYLYYIAGASLHSCCSNLDLSLWYFLFVLSILLFEDIISNSSPFAGKIFDCHACQGSFECWSAFGSFYKAPETSNNFCVFSLLLWIYKSES